MADTSKFDADITAMQADVDAITERLQNLDTSNTAAVQAAIDEATSKLDRVRSSLDALNPPTPPAPTA